MNWVGVELDRTLEALRRAGFEHVPEVVGELLAAAVRELLGLPQVIKRVCDVESRYREERRMRMALRLPMSLLVSARPLGTGCLRKDREVDTRARP